MNETGTPYVADAVRTSWVHRLLPVGMWPYAQLARWERPIGWWLLMWPCWWSIGMAQASPLVPPVGWLEFAGWLGLFMAGAIAMRGAGCTYNDLVDQEIDEKVARTRSRPLPSGRATRRGAVLFLGVQALAGLLILLQFNWTCIGLGVLSLTTVAIYPYMKRITWWPQLFLGLAFSWGALMGWPAISGALAWPPVMLYLGSILWVIGYDTIYAHQDLEDDALVGVKSTARLFAERSRMAIAALFAGSLVLFAASWLAAGLAWPGWLGLIGGACHLAWQLVKLDTGDPAMCLALFKSNSHFGWIMFAGLMGAALVS